MIQFIFHLLLIFHVTARNILHPIEVKGYKLFDSVTGDEFLVRGIDYYPRPNYGDLNQNSLDLFSNRYRHIWERDVEYLKQLNVNVIRLYAVNASENHDDFMYALEEAGIYVMVALARDCPTCAITRDAAPDCYPPELKLQGQRVIRAFSKYTNTLAFSAGNEVNHFAPPNKPEWNAPCQKKFIRDMRKYLASCSEHMRQIPIGLVSADNEREDIAQYYNCEETDEYDRAEWCGINTYVSCDGAAKQYSDAPGFKLLEESFARLNYSIPVLLTEFGCLSESFPTIDGYEGQRNFLQGKWLLTEPTLREQFSGGVAFEYSVERANAGQYPFRKFNKQGYGIGYFSPELCDDITIHCQYNPMPSYRALQNIYAEAKNNTGMKLDVFEIPRSRVGSSVCPKRFKRLDSFEWEADQTEDLSCTDNHDLHIDNDYKGGVEKEQFLTRFGNSILFATAVLILIVAAIYYKCSENETLTRWLMSRWKSSPENKDSDALLSLQALEHNYASICSDSSME